MLRKFYWTSLFLLMSFSAVRSNDCDDYQQKILEYVKNPVHQQDIYASGQCFANCGILASRVAKLFAIPVNEPDFFVAVIKHKDTTPAIIERKGPLLNPLHYLLPQNVINLSSFHKKVIWRYHVVLLYKKQIIDLDIEDPNKMKPVREYIQSTFKPIVHVEDFRVTTYNHWDQLEVYKVPVSNYLNPEEFDQIKGVTNAFKYPKQTLMEFYSEFFIE